MEEKTSGMRGWTRETHDPSALRRADVDRARIVSNCEQYVGAFEDGYRVNVEFSEIPYVPTGTLKVRVKRNGLWTEQEEKVERWRMGKARSIDFTDVDKMDVKPSSKCETKRWLIRERFPSRTTELAL